MDIEELARLIRHHRDRYYNEAPEITDDAYDALEAKLRALDPEHPVLAEVGAPVPGRPSPSPLGPEDPEVAGLAQALRAESESFFSFEASPDPKAYKSRYQALLARAPEHPVFLEVVPARGLEWPKASHEIPMGSLNKVNASEELRAWATRCDGLAEKAELPPISEDLFVNEKLDGISIEVVFQDGRYETAITRGDGVVGERIGPNVRRMEGVPGQIQAQGRISVRGEIILRRSRAADFEAFKRRIDPRFEQLKSLRNTASGLARAKDLAHLPACSFLSAMFYEVEGVEGLITESEKMAWLMEQGFQVPAWNVGDLARVAQIHGSYEERLRAELDYDIDGLVVRAHDVETLTLLGELNHRPRAAVAFKFGNDMQLSTLRAIEWNTGDSGRITPVAVIDPVFLAGAEVRNASLHNVGLVQQLGIGVGDQVMVSRRNDVIPYVESVEVDGGERELPPERCSSCDTPVVQDGEYLLCPNETCPARMQGRIKVWIKQLGLLEWGEKTIETLFSEGLVREPADLYRLTVEDVVSLKGYGESTARKLLEPLQASKQIPLPSFIAALGISAVSKETGKLLVGAGFDSLEKLDAATPEALAEVDGLGEIKAERIKAGLTLRQEEITRLAILGVEPVPPEEGGPLSGLSFCFSGSHGRPRKELATLVESNGGTVRSGVARGLSYLVLADPDSTSAKAEKARRYGTEIIDEAGFESVLRAQGVPV
ncbi:MAG: NAD-dependent DNA ligase LigA [Myxococcota bacterium]